MARWLGSKAVWAAIGLTALSVADFLGGDGSTGSQRLLEALSVLGLRHGIWKAQG